VSENQAAYPIATMCRLLGVPPPAAIMRGRSECRRGVHKQMLCCSRRSGQRMRPRMATSERRDPSLRPGFAIPLHRVRAALPGGGRALDGLGPRCLRQRHVPKASLPRWSASCLLGAGSTAKPRRARRSSSSSKASIIAAAAIPRSAISRRSLRVPPCRRSRPATACRRARGRQGQALSGGHKWPSLTAAPRAGCALVRAGTEEWLRRGPNQRMSRNRRTK